MPLSLELPAPDPRLAAIVEKDAKVLRQWLISIAGSNVAESGRQIHDALASLNRVPLEADVRLKLLDEYRSTLDVMAGEFAARGASQGMPMRDKARQASLLLRALLVELSIGYKLALVDRLERRSFFGNNARQVPYLVQQVLLLNYRVYQLSCQMAMPLPPGMWRETHTLFRHVAEARQLDEPHGEDAGPPVAVIYKRILLLALADPLRFSAMELDKVIEIIDNYAPAAHFQPLSHLASSGGFFLVQLETDLPPHFYGNRTPEETEGATMLVDTIELGKKLHKMLHSLEAKAPVVADRAKIQFWMDVVRRLLKQWSIAPRRVFQRIHKESTVDICTGLRAVTACATPVAPDLNSDMLDQSGVGNLSESSGQQWRVLNESPGGYALSRKEAAPERLRVGELVSVRAHGGEAWLYGAVRWLQQSEDGGLEMGVQILAPRAELVLLHPADDLPGMAPVAALLLPELSMLRQPAQIVAPRGTWSQGRTLQTTLADGSTTLTISRLVERQAGFELFEFKLDGRHSATPATAQ
ncbi:hypothetical protein [Amantichitinum ursilacus]|uniref:Molecular chaperone n=1 Tax=Amantichitinum ursilacus TaxID=857265 RepID=A0A0N0XLR2_9NEIS|nr:hypothetical protein [Amantichitinum ursilacus]KPC54296.1 hypothetical protein WG78_06590 [Amantichitinum ursilacus]